MTEPKPQPYTFDLGHLLCTDSNPLPPLTDDNKEAVLAATARDCAQALINQLLTTCPISRSTDDGNLQISLPTSETHLPREKPVPTEKEKSKWTKFAEKKGIKGKRKDGKLTFDEAKGDWAPRYGYKGKGKDGGVGEDWLVEVDEKAEKVEKAEKAGADGGERGGTKKARKGR